MSTGVSNEKSDSVSHGWFFNWTVDHGNEKQEYTLKTTYKVIAVIVGLAVAPFTFGVGGVIAAWVLARAFKYYAINNNSGVRIKMPGRKREHTLPRHNPNGFVPGTPPRNYNNHTGTNPWSFSPVHTGSGYIPQSTGTIPVVIPTTVPQVPLNHSNNNNSLGNNMTSSTSSSTSYSSSSSTTTSYGFGGSFTQPQPSPAQGPTIGTSTIAGSRFGTGTLGDNPQNTPPPPSFGNFGQSQAAGSRAQPTPPASMPAPRVTVQSPGQGPTMGASSIAGSRFGTGTLGGTPQPTQPPPSFGSYGYSQPAGVRGPQPTVVPPPVATQRTSSYTQMPVPVLPAGAQPAGSRFGTGTLGTGGGFVMNQNLPAGQRRS